MAEGAVPDPGQLVEVRRRQFVVTDVERSTLPVDPLRLTGNGAQHLVSLSSVEDDGLGDELQVIWEIEPGARVHEKGLLPSPSEGFDAPDRLDAFLDAVRWGAIESADSNALQSPFRSGIAIEDYQLDPVARAIVMPRVNLLIADDVGLGKTIEAGLVAQELILRHRVRTVLVICPASLQLKWRDEMRDRFGLEFRIVDSDALRELRRRRGLRVNPWIHFPRLITSIDFLKRERSLRRFRECLPAPGESVFPRRFDLMIVDEAHNVAPAGTGRYATESQRTLAIRTLVPHFEHKLFLTATPHNGYKESFSALLELLDDQRFARTRKVDEKQLEAVMVHRLKTELRNPDGSMRFQPRRLEALEVEYPDPEREAHAKLRRYAELRQKDTREGSKQVATEFVLKLLKKRLFSSPAAFASTLGEHQKTLRGFRNRKPRKVWKPKVLRRELERTQEESADDERWEQGLSEAVGTATVLFDDLSHDEHTLLRELSDWAERTSRRPDAKAKRLLEWIEGTLRDDGQWNDERAIIFTEYRATQKWLETLLAANLPEAASRVATIYGGMDSDVREEIKAAFQASPRVAPIRILLATDAASEGIDLQNWCHRVVHYEIPWNPSRLEQRNGRVDRHGQRFQPLVYHFVGRGWNERTPEHDLRAGDLEGDLEFLCKVAQKVEQIREDLGKVGPVLESQIEAAMLGRRKGFDIRAAEREAQSARRSIRFERDLRARIARLHGQLQESRRELHVTPESVRAVVEMGLALAGQLPLERTEVDGLRAFRLPPLTGQWARCTEGLEHPHTRDVRPIVFDHAAAAGRDDVVLVHLGHRLVQMCQRLLRAEVWSPGDRRRLHRVTARVVPDDALDVPAVLAHGRLLVLGKTDRRLHEEVISAGGLIREGRLSRLNVGQTRAALASASPEEPPEGTKLCLQETWKRIEGAVTSALEARMRDRTKGLEKRLQEKAEKEISNLTTVMEELAATIRAELEATPSAQLELDLELENDDQRSQFYRDREELERRLKRIPDEIAQESARILDSYADPVPRLFPVAITFLVPRKLART